MPSGRTEDALLSALDDAAGYLSRIAGSVRVIAAHVPSKAIRQELRRIIAAIEAIKDCHAAVRAAYHEELRRR